MENLYEILEVSKNASKEVIEKAYKVLAKRYHPDVANDKIMADKMMKKINNAYAILSDDEQRKKYDEQLNIEEKGYDLQQNNYTKYETVKVEEVKTIHINNKVLIALIIISIILFIFCISHLVNSVVNISDNKGNLVEVQEHISENVLEQLVIAFENFEVDKIRDCLVDTNILDKENVKVISENIDMYKLLLPKLELNVVQIKVSEDKAELSVEITRNDVESIYIQYYFSRALGLNKLTANQEKELLLKSTNENTKQVTVKESFIAKKVDNEWKIELNNTNIIYLLGMSISNYSDVFELIN